MNEAMSPAFSCGKRLCPSAPPLYVHLYSTIVGMWCTSEAGCGMPLICGGGGGRGWRRRVRVLDSARGGRHSDADGPVPGALLVGAQARQLGRLCPSAPPLYVHLYSTIVGMWCTSEAGCGMPLICGGGGGGRGWRRRVRALDSARGGRHSDAAGPVPGALLVGAQARQLGKRQTKGLSRVWMRMCERRLLRELKPRWQMTQRMRPAVIMAAAAAAAAAAEEDEEEEEEEEEEDEPSQAWNSSGPIRDKRSTLSVAEGWVAISATAAGAMVPLSKASYGPHVLVR
ncbi:LOW QUALITY PROTEIN: hypothetical protein CRUP_029684 [Coryphaenoides rupestris]|nr:LOW QUALITY PROTEIN: hypothetical protein CRUP_029684 [Coryphaenoides rupestris]